MHQRLLQINDESNENIFFKLTINLIKYVCELKTPTNKCGEAL